jgi:hypothetical protein
MQITKSDLLKDVSFLSQLLKLVKTLFSDFSENFPGSGLLAFT